MSGMFFETVYSRQAAVTQSEARCSSDADLLPCLRRHESASTFSARLHFTLSKCNCTSETFHFHRFYGVHQLRYTVRMNIPILSLKIMSVEKHKRTKGFSLVWYIGSSIVPSKMFCKAENASSAFFDQASARTPAGGVNDASPDPQAGCGNGKPLPHFIPYSTPAAFRSTLYILAPKNSPRETKIWVQVLWGPHRKKF